MNLDIVERGLVVRALSESGGNKSKAARLLGLSARSFTGASRSTASTISHRMS